MFQFLNCHRLDHKNTLFGLFNMAPNVIEIHIDMGVLQAVVEDHFNEWVDLITGSWWNWLN